MGALAWWSIEMSELREMRWMGRWADGLAGRGKGDHHGGRAGRFIGRGAVSFTTQTARVLRPVGRRQLTRVGPFPLRGFPTRNCLGCALSVSLQV